MNKNMPKSMTVIFWAMVALFLFIFVQLFVPYFENVFGGKGAVIFLMPFIVFSLLGAVLTVLAARSGLKKNIKGFIILTGASATAVFIGVFLHNFFYALGSFFRGIVVVKHLMDVLHVAFFFLALVIAPLGFLVGVIGTIIISKKK